MSTLEKKMVLHRFMCNQFDYPNLSKMLNRLKGVQDGLAENNTTHFYQAINAYLHTHSKEVTKNDLARYDENIIAHSQTLRMTVDNGKTWKSFQYVALLFTERYLDLYFQDPEVLVEKLNQWKKSDSASGMADYTPADLRHTCFSKCDRFRQDASFACQYSAIQTLSQEIQTTTQTQQNNTGNTGRRAFPTAPA